MQVARSAADLFTFRGHKTLGIFATPAGRKQQKFPAVLMLHGYPGAEKSADLQHQLMQRGIASFALHFQGAWGSEGLYRFSTLTAQARAALKHLARKPNIDAKRLAVFGFSMGGWTAIQVGAREAKLKGVVAVAPVGGAEMLIPAAREFVERVSVTVKSGSPKATWSDFSRTVKQNDVATAATKIKAPLLLLHGDCDEVVPYPISQRILKARPQTKFVRARGADHSFLDRRRWLVKRCADWLATLLLDK
jgi:dipeptidyl aminopeptidase/acylaminoacyl peptidase